jgi:malate synthase
LATIKKMSMDNRPNPCALKISPVFSQFVEGELLPLIGMDPDEFWVGLESIIEDLTPVNQALLAKRGEIQSKINAWHEERQGQAWDHDEYVSFLREIAYLVPTGEPFSIETENVDREIAEVAGPQLVVPVSNARFAINAANARWGSLYDALYGTDAISDDNGQQREGRYNPVQCLWH